MHYIKASQETSGPRLLELRKALGASEEVRESARRMLPVREICSRVLRPPESTARGQPMCVDSAPRGRNSTSPRRPDSLQFFTLVLLMSAHRGVSGACRRNYRKWYADMQKTGIGGYRPTFASDFVGLAPSETEQANVSMCSQASCCPMLPLILTIPSSAASSARTR